MGNLNSFFGMVFSKIRKGYIGYNPNKNWYNP